MPTLRDSVSEPKLGRVEPALRARPFLSSQQLTIHLDISTMIPAVLRTNVARLATTSRLAALPKSAVRGQARFSSSDPANDHSEKVSSSQHSGSP